MAGPSKDLREEILTQNIWRLMATLSFPAIIAMSINGINAFVDALFVGRFLGQDALAAVSLAFPLMMITNGISAMIGVGASSLLSRAIGAGEEDIQRKSFGTTVALSLITSLILSAVAIYFARDLIRFLGGTGDILEMGTEYYQIMMIGAFFRIFAVAANMLIRAEGKIKEAMIMAIFSAVLNMILTPLFLGYFEWGIAGAAWATIFSMIAFTLFDLWYFLTRRTDYEISLTTFSLEKKLLRPILAVGVSAMMLQIMFFLQQAVVFKSLAHYGDDWDLALMGACYRVLLLTLFPSFGIAQAMQPVVGINYGAQVYDRVKKAYTIFSISSSIIMILCWVFIMLYPRTILGWMLPDAIFSTQDIFNYRLLMWPLPLFPVFFMGTTLYQAIGKAKEAGLFLVAREVILYVPMLLILPIFYSVKGIYLAGVPVNIIVFIGVIVMVTMEFRRWKKNAPKAI